ncbi:MAG: hypothetical protein ACRDJ1_03050 [Actinomycetota bacterium]
MRKVLLAALLVTGVLVQTQPAAACTCAVRSVPEQLEAAAVVFAGTVATVGSTSDGKVAATFDLTALYKGDAGRRVRVTTAEGTAACGIPFARETTYVVFATGSPGTLTTGTCNGTTDDESVVLGLTPIERFAPPDGELPGDDTGSRSLPIGTAAGLLALVLAGSIWAWLMRMRPPRALV